jgi:hypothetical protein
MTNKPPKVEDEPGAEERFERGIKNALAMAPKPHKEKREPGKPNSRSASVPEKG